MGCLIFLFALIGPRVALVYTWIFTGFISRAYDSAVLPFLGLLIAPWTTLVYALAYDGREVSTIGWIFVGFAVLADLSSHAASFRHRQVA